MHSLLILLIKQLLTCQASYIFEYQQQTAFIPIITGKYREEEYSIDIYKLTTAVRTNQEKYWQAIGLSKNLFPDL